MGGKTKKSRRQLDGASGKNGGDKLHNCSYSRSVH